MADSESKFWTFLKGVGGVAGAVIAGVLVYYFTQSKPAPAPAPTPQIGLNGFVANVVSQRAIPDALVTIYLGERLATQKTDSEGRYSFVMDAASNDSVTVDVLAGGYQHYVDTLSLRPGDNFAELEVPPEAAAGPVVPDNAHIHIKLPAAPVAPKAALVLHPPMDYKVRAESARIPSK